jgi:single-strand DNA-binding protein
MANMNVVMLAGNLTADPELKPLNESSSVCALRMAINRKYKDRNGEMQEDTCFINVDVFGKQAESCNTYLRKGSPLIVEGRLQMDQWQDKESGQNRSRLKIIANRIQFLNSKNQTMEHEFADAG